MKPSKSTVRDAVRILDLCAFTPGFPMMGDAAASIGANTSALLLAGCAWAYATLPDESMHERDARAASMLRNGWLP